MIPFWLWFATAFVGIGLIAVSAIVVITMKLREIDAHQLERARGRAAGPPRS